MRVACYKDNDNPNTRPHKASVCSTARPKKHKLLKQTRPHFFVPIIFFATAFSYFCQFPWSYFPHPHVKVWNLHHIGSSQPICVCVCACFNLSESPCSLLWESLQRTATADFCLFDLVWPTQTGHTKRADIKCRKWERERERETSEIPWKLSKKEVLTEFNSSFTGLWLWMTCAPKTFVCSELRLFLLVSGSFRQFLVFSDAGQFLSPLQTKNNDTKFTTCCTSPYTSSFFHTQLRVQHSCLDFSAGLNNAGLTVHSSTQSEARFRLKVRIFQRIMQLFSMKFGLWACNLNAIQEFLGVGPPRKKKSWVHPFQCCTQAMASETQLWDVFPGLFWSFVVEFPGWLDQSHKKKQDTHFQQRRKARELLAHFVRQASVCFHCCSNCSKYEFWGPFCAKHFKNSGFYGFFDQKSQLLFFCKQSKMKPVLFLDQASQRQGKVGCVPGQHPKTFLLFFKFEKKTSFFLNHQLFASFHLAQFFWTYRLQ